MDIEGTLREILCVSEATMRVENENRTILCRLEQKVDAILAAIEPQPKLLKLSVVFGTPTKKT
jgi:hypothetical protein